MLPKRFFDPKLYENASLSAKSKSCSESVLGVILGPTLNILGSLLETFWYYFGGPMMILAPLCRDIVFGTFFGHRRQRKIIDENLGFSMVLMIFAMSIDA